MVDYELMNEMADNDEQEIREVKEEYEILVRLEKEEEEKPNYFDDNDSDEGYY